MGISTIQLPLVYDANEHDFLISPSDSLLDKPMALLILQDSLSTSSLSSISSSSDLSSNSSSARDKPLPAIVDAGFASSQEAKLEFTSFIPTQNQISDEEEFHTVKHNDFRQKVKRIFSKHSHQQHIKHSIFDTKLRRRSAPVNLTMQSISPIAEQQLIHQEKTGLRRWRSVLSRNSISTERQSSEIQVASLARSQFTPRRRTLSEDNRRLKFHMSDPLDYICEPSRDYSTPPLRHSRSLASVNRLKVFLGVGKSPIEPLAQPKKTVHFDANVEVLPTYDVFQYNRASDRSNTCYTLNADSAFQIREELNRFKLYEMEVHVRSRYMTHFIP